MLDFIDTSFSKYNQRAIGIELAKYFFRGRFAFRLTIKLWRLYINFSTVRTIKLER